MNRWRPSNPLPRRYCLLWCDRGRSAVTRESVLLDMAVLRYACAGMPVKVGG